MSEETVSIKVASCMGYGTLVDIAVADLEALGFTRTVVKPWMPEHGDDYCYLDAQGWASSSEWEDDRFDIARWNMGNCYKTSTEATKAQDKQLAIIKVLRRLRELEGDWVANWSDGMQVKTTPCYDYNSNSMVLMCKSSSVSAPPTWHSTYEAWEQVLKELEPDVKLMMGVE